MLPSALCSSGADTKTIRESRSQPTPAVTAQPPVLAENGAQVLGILTPSPAAHIAPSITGTGGLSWDADSMFRTPQEG